MRFNTPVNVIKRADELIAVGQHNAALTALQDVITNKRSRSASLTVMEPIVLKFVTMSVEQKKGKVAKEGLHQYKNMAQNTSISTIEVVIKHFIELAEAKVQEAQSKAEKITLDLDDLEATETPEDLMISTVSSEVNKDRTDRAVVTPWLKFLWETYRTCLDILRNNARLEALYQTAAHQAFQFCLRYGRKTEFRRLCDLLRNHLQSVAKYSHQPHSVNLNEPESLQRYLETRFSQLNAATELELWQEAFRSVEDIHQLLTMAKKPPKTIMMANYYEKLTKIFLMSENYLFHSAAWNKYYLLTQHQASKLGTADEQQRLASLFLLSALAIPIINPSKSRGYMQIDESKLKTHRLTALLGLVRIPTRAGLLKEALNKNVLKKVSPELLELYNILEVEFHPLSICKRIAPIMAALSIHEEYSKYCKPLHEVVLTRLLQQLSQVYTTIKLSTVLKLAQFPEPFTYDASDLEKFIMNGCKRGELSIRIDHETQTLIFEPDLLVVPNGVSADGPRLQAIPSELIRTQLTRLARCLHTTVCVIDPTAVEARQRAKQEAFKAALSGMQEEHNAALARKAVIERKKEIIETLMMRKEKEEAREKAIRMQREAEAERVRQIEEQRKRELERIRKDTEAIQKEEARKIAETLKPFKGVKVDVENLKDLDKDKLIALQVDQIEKEKQEMATRLRAIMKRMDHQERAFRKAEIPLLEKDYEHQRKVDAAYHEATTKASLETAKIKHESDVKEKSRFSGIVSDYDAYRASMEERRREEFEQRRKEAALRIEEAKEARRELYRQKKAELARRAEEEARARTRREEEERRVEEERKANAEQLRQKALREKEEFAERKKKLDEMAEKQAARDREIESKRKGASTAPSSGGAYRPPGSRGEGATSPLLTRGAPSSGAYKPPSARGEGGASPPSSRPPASGKYIPPSARQQGSSPSLSRAAPGSGNTYTAPRGGRSGGA